ncbi:pentatricopeptide repeat-containing protein At3g49740 [Magnolia sinica]|uniref:pentatricopeptide repeat-containing protein At3g49740 n=1 Tax=Magnolia sinica TaxID=86752 RepID=UPI002657B11A|nr:pentatricopeptide repeat-containing protein At3g49740 [Magnolia sinica]
MKFTFQGQTITIKPTQIPTQLLIRLNALISKLTHSNQHLQALQLFNQIHSSNHLKPDHYTLASTLTACAAIRDTAAGNQIHAHAIRSGFKAYAHVSNTLLSLYAKSNDLDSTRRLFDEFNAPDVYSWTTLLSAYAKSGQIDHASLLFDRMPQRNVAVWNVMITGYVECGCPEVAFEMFDRMHQLGVGHDHYSFASVLSSCCSPELLDSGKQVHSLVIRTGFLARVSVINAQLTMYFNCGLIKDAFGVFEDATTCNQITFNAMISGLVNWGRDVEALTMFLQMQESCFGPTELTFMSVLSACSSAKMAKLGCQIHTQVIKLGFEACVLVSNAAINMYSNCGNLPNAQLVFERLEEKDLVSWNSMITGFAQGKCRESAIWVYKQMRRAGIEPDDFTFGSLLACTEFFENIEIIQAAVAKNGLISSIQVGNALISAFSDYGKIQHACHVFREMTFRNLISWNSIISGCVLNGFPVLGLELFYQMQTLEFKPNIYTLSIVLSACASISALRHGKQIHAYILRSELDLETSLGNPLITMYAKSGVLDLSARVFCGMPERDVVTWNAMVAAYAQHGDGKEAIRCFKAMRELGIEPDAVTFTTVLSACSHAGLVDEGHCIFLSMVKDYRMEPSVDHYSCIIDLLGRAGHLDEAERLVNSMPFQMDSHIWWALLGACRVHSNVRLGRVAAGFLLEIEPENPAVYVLLSHIYAAAGQWEEAASVRELMKKNGVMKMPGCSWVE